MWTTWWQRQCRKQTHGKDRGQCSECCDKDASLSLDPVLCWNWFCINKSVILKFQAETRTNLSDNRQQVVIQCDLWCRSSEIYANIRADLEMANLDHFSNFASTESYGFSFTGTAVAGLQIRSTLPHRFWTIVRLGTNAKSSTPYVKIFAIWPEVFRHFSVSSLYVNALENSFFVRVHVSNGGHSEDTESPGASLCARKSKTAEACGVKKWLRLTNCPAVRDPHEVLLWHAGGRKPAQRSISIPIFRTIGCVFAAKIAKIQFSCIVLAMEHEIFYRFAWNWHM